MIEARSADGVIHRFPDNTPQSVIDKTMRDYAGTRNALADIQAREKTAVKPVGDEFMRTATGTFTGGLTTAEEAAANALGTAARQAYAKISGTKGPLYSPGDAFNATLQFRKAQEQQYAQEHPYQNIGAQLFGGLGMMGLGPSSLAAAKAGEPTLAGLFEKYVLGPKATNMGTGLIRATRGAAGTGVLGAEQAAMTTPVDKDYPKEVGEAGLKTAAFAPVAELGLRGAGAAGRAVAGAGKKIAKTFVPPPAAVTLSEKLAKAFQDEHLPASMLTDALDELRRNGATSPTLVDILKRAGAGPKVWNVVAEGGTYGPARVAAERNMQAVSDAVQPTTVAHIKNTLVSPETRTPAQITQDLQASVAGKDQPVVIVAPGESGLKIHQELNAAKDTSQENKNALFRKVAEADPNAAFVSEDARNDAVDSVLDDLGAPNPYVPGTAKIHAIVAGMKSAPVRGEATETAEDLAAALASGVPIQAAGEAAPAELLTMKDIYDRIEGLHDIASRAEKGSKEQTYATQAARLLRNKVMDLHDAGSIMGVPDVVPAWRAANEANKLHMDTFHAGDLVDTITERTPWNVSKEAPFSKSRYVLDPRSTSDAILGNRDQGLTSTLTLVPDLEKIQTLVSPKAFRGLQEEAVSRLPPDQMAAFTQRRPDLAKTLLPEDLVEQTAANQKAIADANAKQAAVDLGQSVLTADADAFNTGVANLSDEHLPLAQAGARHAVTSAVEKGTPLASLQHANTQSNVSGLFDPDAATQFHEGVRDISEQAMTAQQIANLMGSRARLETPLLAQAQPYDLLDPKRAVAHGIIAKVFRGSKLTQAEKAALPSVLGAPYRGPKSAPAPSPGTIMKVPSLDQVQSTLPPFALSVPAAVALTPPRANQSPSLDELLDRYNLNP